MSEVPVPHAQKSFVDELAADAVMTATILRDSVHGKEAIGRIVAIALEGRSI